MKPFIKSILKFLLIYSCFLLISACSVNNNIKADFKEGYQYKLISPQQERLVDDERVEVIEMFFYACPHCSELEAKINAWVAKNKGKINFQRIPAIVSSSWVSQAKAYYIAQELGLLDKLHTRLFATIHEQGKQLYNDDTLMEFFINQGVDRQAFIQANNSPNVADNLNKARLMTVKYGLRGVPAVIINGKYKTAPFYTRNQEEMISVLDMLVDREKNNHGK